MFANIKYKIIVPSGGKKTFILGPAQHTMAALTVWAMRA